jgi:collagen type I/II/III/V/XI/XXIV/XXVII alpha
VTFAAGDTASLVPAGTLTILKGGNPVFTFSSFTAPAGVTSAGFAVDTHSVQEIACFRSGTRLATPDGLMAVERLAVGELVLTREGAWPVRWIGQRHIDCRRHPRPLDVWPVRICAYAFGPDAPRAELFLSPDHAVLVDGVLIPIRHLINGSSIAQAPVDEVTYYHVELPHHDVLLAEGLPAESYLDTGNRSNFANSGGPVVLHPDFASLRWEAEACVPLVVTGPKLDAAQRLVSRQATAAMAWRRAVGTQATAAGRTIMAGTNETLESYG